MDQWTGDGLPSHDGDQNSGQNSGAADTCLMIELCGRLADSCGAHVPVVIPGDGCDVATVLARLSEQRPQLAPALSRSRVRACVNEAIASEDMWVHPQDIVALFPPVSGG